MVFHGAYVNLRGQTLENFAKNRLRLTQNQNTVKKSDLDAFIAAQTVGGLAA